MDDDGKYSLKDYKMVPGDSSENDVSGSLN